MMTRHWSGIGLCGILSWLAVPARAQHDHARDAVQALARGNVEQAVETLEQPDRPNRSPLAENEKRFVHVLAACRRGDGRAAWRHAREALEHGMPIERFQAGPRDALAPLREQPEYREYVARHGAPLLHGPQLGAMTDRGARIWVRTAEPAEVRAVLTRPGDDAAEPLRSDAVRTAPERDYTAVVAVDGLEPDTAYEYRILLDGRPVGEAHRLRTFPAAGRPARFRVGMGGGAGFTPEYERMWNTLAEHDLSLFLLLGDNVYIDDPEHVLTQRYCYYRRQSQPEFRGFAGRTPLAAIYDDHDFGTNDCVPGPDVDSPPWKRDVWKVFRQNWANPSYGGGADRPGCWFDFQLADVHFILLDTRYYRDLDGGSMLGEAQQRWLRETLRGSEARVKLLISSVPFSPGVKPGSRDTWDGFPEEREEIFSFIESESISGVLLLSADRHRTDLRRIPRPEGRGFYELMSSKLTNVHTHPLVENAKGSEFLFGYNERPSFGLLEFDTTADPARVEIRAIDIDGTERGSHTLRLGEF